MLRALWFNENAYDEHWPLSILLGQPAGGRAINRRVCAVPKRLVAHGCSYEADQVCIMLIILKVAKIS